MDVNDYQRQAMRTNGESGEHQTVNAALGLVGEAGDVARLVGAALDGDDSTVERLLRLAEHVGQMADHVKKGRYHGHAINHGLLAHLLTAVRQATANLEYAVEAEYLHGAPDRNRLGLVRPDAGKLSLEAGDVAWYVAQLADSLDLGLADVLHRNLDKLAARYPEGFSEQASRERAE